MALSEMLLPTASVVVEELFGFLGQVLGGGSAIVNVSTTARLGERESGGDKE
jgi:hypothetical protein